MCDIKGCGNQRKLPPIRISNSERRLFLKGLISLPLATVLAYPELARAMADGTQTVMIKTQSGQKVSAALAMPDAKKAPCILLIHEWWGLNDQIRSVAVEFSKLGYFALAVDLYGGEIADSPESARALMQNVDPNIATDILVSWIDYLKKSPSSTSKVGTVGWCFGGGWSLNASLATPVDATVIYYGNVRKTAENLASLQRELCSKVPIGYGALHVFFWWFPR